MWTSAPTDPVCGTQAGATCHLFADTTGGTLTEPAANSHASGEATASMATTADDAPVVTMVELPAYDPPATQASRQHAAPLAGSPVLAAQGGSWFRSVLLKSAAFSFGMRQKCGSIGAIHVHRALVLPAHLCSTHLPAASSAALRK
ncbi:hypothetical protein MTO96_040898 [Rhipicephalus appendiculatus]